MNKPFTFKNLAASMAFFALSGSVFAQSDVSLEAALGHAPGIQNEAQGAFAFDAVREIGMTYGMRGGLAWENRRIGEMLERHAARLDRIYNFQPLMLKESVAPPVMVQTTETYDQKNPDHVVVADAVYKIERPERFRYTPPNWREYLLRSDQFNPAETGGWTPRTEAERAAWEKAVREGWQVGITQAHEMLEANFARLSRDLEGMILYRKLVARNMTTVPVVSSSEMGVTGNDRELNINERVLRIESPARMKHDPFEWRTSTTPRDR